MKLKNKIHLWSTLLMLVVLFLLAIVIYFTFSRLAYDTEVSQLQAELESVVAAISSNPEENPRNILRGYVPANGLIRVTGETGLPVPDIQDPDVAAEFPGTLPDDSGTIAVEENQYAYASVPVIWTGGGVVELTMAQSLEEVTGNLQTLRFVIIAAILVAMVPIIVSSAVLGRLVTRPIADLTETMSHIQRSGQFEKLPITGAANDEVGQMGSTFNDMMALLEENYRKQEEFVSNASHELKTPLTVIGSYAKLLERQGMQDEKIAHEGLAAIRTETERMNKLIEQLLHIARRSETQLELSEVDLEEVLEQTLKVMTTSFNREFRLNSKVSGVIVTTDIEKLKQLLYILLDNARKYSADRIEVEIDHQHAPIIRITDYGIGIPKDALPFVFERFYRVDKARSRESGGFGLGLSLAKQLADSLHATLEIDSIEQKGTTVSIIFSSDFNVQEVQSHQEGL